MDAKEQRALEAREAKRTRRLKTALIVLMVAVMVDVATAISMARGIIPPTTVAIITLAAITISLAALAAVLGHAPGPEARRLAASPGRPDREQNARTGQMMALTVSSGVFALIAVLRGGDIVAGDIEFSAIAVIAAFAIIAMTLPAMVMNWDGGARAAKRYLEDELTRAFRARAIVTGFWVLLPAVLAVYLIGLWRPEQAIVFMPLALWAGAAAATVHFTLLNRAADPDE
ncbi:hypothetical protein N0B44_08490 [Roseibacterium beibuensis]|uniref:hypothetical protein n=1 Tax=[Roseibacterium] beibuensis TaxID=1193142 RepID=UPI00217CE239|nr:hypothetical protein [Roseibacterium beibuensis]MCS6622944.1 hypothetical protein [Roseibacterium beibuensis]